MFEAITETIEPDLITRYRLVADGAPLTFASVIRLWETDHEFRAFNTRLLANSPFPAFRWETPALTHATAINPFEFVVLNSPQYCLRSVDSNTFASHFTDDDADSGVVRFENLGRDATMIVPSPRGSLKVYGHFADFIRGAPSRQVDAMWRVIGKSVTARLDTKPLWINTAGGGVAWLHVRLDTRPKYYGYRPYQQVDYQSEPSG